METTQFRLTILGHNPAPQGSKKYAGHRYNARTGRSQPLLLEESKRVAPWRKTVTLLARQAMARQRLTRPLDGPLQAKIIFCMEPSAQARKELTKDPHGTFPTTRHYGDNDKLQRSTFDGLADAGVMQDDARVIHVEAVKVFPGFFRALDQPGCYVHIRTLEPGNPGMFSMLPTPH